ncbi:MAG: bifunctional DNA-formamidopyrimidine glycosylase/DNA-(apurinic or apyrimidinic site) lyase [Planctomycetales bacterium]|nr:bifunctional DNA-formamidopyrimidine glycosylase/DNA-(apurinic or apyrimidinic site) lyase [Planctomycetales bacterium]MBN8624934.1 bifunctional DNA-formamidopyrimidine glycosylase/DNA-(apurinic or apyrimidinic site) lyase [Planctomycetota bacterium]
MPELPEVETMRRGILSIVGRRIREAERMSCPRKPIEVSPKPAAFRKRTVGRKVSAVDRLGKRVVIRLEGGDSIILEPRMTGLVLLADPPTTEHLRFRLTLDDGRSVYYWDRRGLGSVRLFSEKELAARYDDGTLGPDALAIDLDNFSGRLKPSRRAIKVALLDQRTVAGIGNLYASEMLHASAIDPRRRCTSLKADEWERLYAAMRDVLLTAVKYEGSTLSDGTYRNALNKAGGYQNHHQVYDRADKPCGTCTTPILRIVQAQRATFYCPTCQAAKRRAKSKR